MKYTTHKRANSLQPKNFINLVLSFAFLAGVLVPTMNILGTTAAAVPVKGGDKRLDFYGQEPTSIEAGTGKTAFGLKSRYPILGGWTDDHALLGGATITVSSESGEFARSCDASSWTSNLTVNIRAFSVIKGTFCYKSSTLGANIISAESKNQNVFGRTVSSSTFRFPVEVTDTISPDINIILPESGSSHGDNVPVSAVITENGSGVRTASASLIDENGTTQSTTALSEAGGTYSGALSAKGMEGRFKVKVSATDNAANSADAEVDNISVDSLGPVATLVSPQSNTAISGIRTFTFKTTDYSGVMKSYFNLINSSNELAMINGSTAVQLKEGSNNEWSASVDTTQLEDGVYTITTRPMDNVSNAKYNKNLGPIVIDNTAPTAAILSPANDGDQVHGNVPIKVAMENEANPMRYWVQVTGQGKSWTAQKETKENEWTFDWDTSTWPNGEYTIRLDVRDKANNKDDISITYRKVVVNNPQPEVIGTDFSTFEGSDYKGIYTQFNFNHFKKITGITVSLYDENGDLIVANTHTQSLLDLIENDNLTSISTPFIVQDLGYGTDNYWNFGDYAWAATSPKPVKVVFEVQGTNNLGQENTYRTELEHLTETTWLFASILPVSNKKPNDQGGGSGGGGSNGHQVLGARTPRGGQGSGSGIPYLPSNPNLAVATSADTQPLGFGNANDTNNAENQNTEAPDDENAEQVAAATTDGGNNSQQSPATNGSGFSWLWLLPVLGGLGLGTYYFAYARREQ